MVSSFPHRGVATPRPRIIVSVVHALFTLGLAGFAGVSSNAWAAQASAPQDAERRAYHIAAGPLDSVLNSFASSAGIELVAEARLTKGKVSAGLSGAYTVAEGFGALLAGQGMEAVRGGSGAYSLRAAAAVAIDSGATLPQISVSAGRDDSLVSEGSKSYAARSSGLLKGSDSLRDIPQTVSVITRQRMDDQQLTSVADIMLQTPGISRSSSNLGNHVYLSRGFEIRNFETDGVPTGFWTQGGYGIAADTAIYDRVEVLRGAPGLLLGNGQPSGVVNFVRKRPLAEKQVDVELQGGSWNNYRAVVDATGPLNDSATLRGRVIAGDQERDYFYDQTHSKRRFIYGVLEYDLDPATKLSAGYRHQQYRENGSMVGGSLPYANNGSDLGLPRSTNFGQPWGHNYTKVDEVFADLTHRFNDRWELTAAANWLRSTWEARNVYFRSGALNPATGSGATVYPYYFDETHKAASADVHVNGRFDWFGRQHKLMFGANYLTETTDDAYYNGLSSLYALNLANPYVAMPAAGAYVPSTAKTVTKGVYGNVQLQLADSLKAIVGGRVSWYHYSANDNGSQTGYAQSSQFSPYAALIQDIGRDWSLYTSYTDIFVPQSNYKASSGDVLKPATGSNYELGIKGELFDQRLTTSLALFMIDQDDRALTDPAYPTSCPSSPASPCYINAGKVRSKGVEAALDGEIARGWQMSVGYTFNRQYFVKDSAANTGKNFNNLTPRHILRAYSSYQLPGDWDKLTVGGGVTAQSPLKYTNSANVSWYRGTYAVANTFARYQIDKTWSLALNVNNIFNRRYFLDYYGQYYAEPRNVMLTLHGHL
jgi:TonB-dependent siderophore receptor